MNQPELANYKAMVHTRFRVRGVEPALELELTEVKENGRSGGYESFSLHFHGPLSPLVPQQLLPLAHAELGDIDIFVVPVGVYAEGYGYEAVFNQLVEK